MNYPSAAPVVLLPDHLKSSGLREHVLDSIDGLAGSPLLYQLFSATQAWVEGHPLSINATPTTQDQQLDHNPTRNVCKFLMKGSCKFGGKCRNYHPDPQVVSPSMEPAEPKNAETISVPSPSTAHQGEHAAGTDTGHSSQESDPRAKNTKKASMRTATDVISRILWDPDINTGEFTIGYLDRFVGVIEKPFTDFSWEDLSSVGINVLAVPKHRIQYFKYREEIVWDKTVQLDNVFGSRGGKVIQDIVEAYADHTSTVNTHSKDVGEGHGSVDAGKKAHTKEERPTHFICIRVDSDEILSSVKRIQDHVINHSPHLADGCLPLTALHVTICMVQLETNSHLETARKVLESTKNHFVQFLPSFSDIVFSGVDNFHDRLIYAKVAPNTALSKYSAFLIERFRRVGLKTPGNHSQFTPHMTLVKMSRPMQHTLHTSVINREAYSKFQDEYIGKQLIGGIRLCSMTEPKQEDGFYKWFCSLSNSLLNLSPLVPTVLAKCVHSLQQSGAIDQTESARLITSTTTTRAGVDTGKFDKCIETIQELVQHEPNMCNIMGTRVVILRGIPGSGKSHLLRSRCEASSVVCSADNYFMQSGRYNFNPAFIPEAHLQCLESFLTAVIDGKEEVYIDNTNSMLWEYRNYVSLCQLLGMQCHILEIPHSNQRVIDAYCGRNLHRVDMASIQSYIQRWEDDKRAMFVSPRLAYPRAGSQSDEECAISILDICKPGYLPKHLLTSSSALTPVYTGIFLTPKSQWKLVSATPPTHTRVQADHITLRYQPSLDAINSTDIGRTVTVLVKSLANDSTVQAATVELPRGVSSENALPHVTVSTDGASSSKLANAMLWSQAATPLADTLKLKGVIGVVVKEVQDGKGEVGRHRDTSSYTILSKKHFESTVLPRLSPVATPTENPPPEVRSHEVGVREVEGIEVSDEVDLCEVKNDKPGNTTSICSGAQKVTELYVFDFDGTLFETPDPVAGRQFYEKTTGQRWPHKGWLSWPESLLPPLKIKPGPSLADYRQHCGRAGSRTVVLTARVTRTGRAVHSVLDDHQLCPDRVILKPGDSRQSTPEFKVDSVRALMRQFPDIVKVKVWDDRDDNLEAMRRFSGHPKNSNIKFEINNATAPTSQTTTLNSHIEVCKSVIGRYLASCGLLPSEEHTMAAETGVHFIGSQFCTAMGFEGDPADVTLVFGSHTIGRTSDVDLCLLAPQRHTQQDCIDKLADQLEKCGITHLHKGYSSRCPRLKVLLQFKDTPSIDFDIVFAMVPSVEEFSLSTLSATGLMDGRLEKLLQICDPVSRTALSGYVLRCRVQEVIKDVVPVEVFGSVVEMAAQVLMAKREKGNCHHHIRTFHIILLLLDFIKKHHFEFPSKVANCDSLFELFITHTAQLSPQSWQAVFQDYIPVAPEYVPHFSDVFHMLSETIARKSTTSLLSCYEDMMARPVFPPPAGYSPVWLLCTGGDHVVNWKLQTLLEAKLPTFIHQLLSTGLDVVLDGNGVRSSFCFAVQETSSTKTTVQLVFRKFWNEFSEYRNRKDVKLELKFSGKLEPECFQEAASEEGSMVSKRVEEFAASQQSDVHFPVTLSSYERLLVHETAERLGLNHETISDGSGKKHVFLYK